MRLAYLGVGQGLPDVEPSENVTFPIWPVANARFRTNGSTIGNRLSNPKKTAHERTETEAQFPHTGTFAKSVPREGSSAREVLLSTA